MPEYQLLKRIPYPPQQHTPIFRLAPPQVNQRALFKLAQRVGLKGGLRNGSLQQDARQMTYLEGSFELVLYRTSGGLRFHDNARWQVDDGKAHVTFDDTVAVKMAQRFLEELALVPLNECQLLRVTRLNVGVIERQTGFAEERVIDVGVAFQRVIGNVPVIGPGGKVIVYIDHNGDLIGIDRIWREIQDVYQPDVELRSPESAQQDVVRHWGEHGSGLIAIEDIRFGYFELGWEDDQRYMQPAYFMPLTISDTDGLPLMRSEHYVAASTNPPEQLMPRPPVVPEQAPRKEQFYKNHEPSEQNDLPS
jgi:hypothetical protein